VNAGDALFFRASATSSKILNGENIFNTVYSVYFHLGVIRVLQTSVLCDLDLSRESRLVTGYMTLIWSKASFFVKIEL